MIKHEDTLKLCDQCLIELAHVICPTNYLSFDKQLNFYLLFHHCWFLFYYYFIISDDDKGILGIYMKGLEFSGHSGDPKEESYTMPINKEGRIKGRGSENAGNQYPADIR